MSHPKSAPWGIRFAFPQRPSPRSRTLGVADRILVAIVAIEVVSIALLALLSTVQP